MEQMPHHREGIQELLDKAHEEGLRDNKAFDEAQAKIAEIKGENAAEEMQGKLSLEEIVVLLKDAGYLDTSFEGKETHMLSVRPLTKEQALEEYKNSGGKTWVWNELEKDMPYMVPNADNLDVMVMNFNKNIVSDEAVAEMDKLGVRPLTYEEFIQFISASPTYQEKNPLAALGSKHFLGGDVRVPVAVVRVGERGLRAGRWGVGWGDGFRFPVVRK